MYYVDKFIIKLYNNAKFYLRKLNKIFDDASGVLKKVTHF